MIRLIGRVLQFITTDIWRLRLEDLPRGKSFLLKQLRVVLLAARGFDEDKLHLRASALTFYTLISVVPVAAMIFGIAKGFGFEKRLERQLLEQFAGQEEILTSVIEFAHSLLEHTKGGVMAGIGIAALLWAVVKVLAHIESSFNDIWGITEPRGLGRKFTDYLSIILIGPVLVIMSSSVSVFITTQITHITEKVTVIGPFGPVLFYLMKLLPFAVIWGLFTFMYIFVPNTKVNLGAGSVAGIIAGTIYQLVQWAYIEFQVGVAKYNAIYGSFAALPLFLVWLQVSWLIVLFGAEISFAHQNVTTYEFEPESLKISTSFRRLLALEVAHLAVHRFSRGEKPFTANQVSQVLEIPIRLVRHIIQELVTGGVLSETSVSNEREHGYQPAIDTNRLTVHYVLAAIDAAGTDDVPVARTREFNVLSETLKSFAEAVAKSPANKLLKDI
jgi:membrane protein